MCLRADNGTSGSQWDGAASGAASSIPITTPIHPQSGDVHREHEYQHNWRDWTLQRQSNVSLFCVHAWILFGDGHDDIADLRSLKKR